MHVIRSRYTLALLVDVDGTLVDSNDAHAAAWSDACSDFGIERDVSFFSPLIGMGADRIVPRILRGLDARLGAGRAIVERHDAVFRDRYLAGVAPVRGARAVVERSRDEGYICVIASSGEGALLEDLLAVAGVRTLVRVPAGPHRRSKPAPDVIVAALQCAEASPRCAIMVGDTPYDVVAAGLAGVPSIALRCGGWPDIDLSGAGEIYDDAADLLDSYETCALSALRAARP